MLMKWYYADGGRQVGPMEEAALDDLARTGVVRDETLVWREGMASWQRLASVRPRPGVPQPPPAPMPATPTGAPQSYCVECGRPLPMSDMVMIGGAPVCAVCKPTYLQRMRESGQTAGQVRYAGFWIRFVARVIDGVLLGVVGLIIRLPLMVMLGVGGREIGSVAMLPAILALAGVMTLINLALAAGYEVYFLSTRGATIGKQILGLRVIRADGGPVSAGLAAGRFLSAILSAIIFYIGFIIAAFDVEKRSLHDRICNTRVICTK
jgi:uncharacterized RDD family membrane protein YckC